MSDNDLKIIGAGFGRTGTDSLRHALTMLGFGPVHHMMHLVENEKNRGLWLRHVQGDLQPWPDLLDGCRAAVDWPCAAYWRDLAALYPDATILLSWRDPEAWWQSFSKTILPRVQDVAAGGDLTAGGLLVWQHVLGGDLSRENCISTYLRNINDVRSEVHPDRLLDYELGSGWEPLCAHLGVPIPDADYPHGNTTQQFNARFAD